PPPPPPPPPPPQILTNTTQETILVSLCGGLVYLYKRQVVLLRQDVVMWEQERKDITGDERMHKGQANVANIRAMLAKPKEKV
ncbi:hypothetical protein, partial [Enterobacter hormaechei]